MENEETTRDYEEIAAPIRALRRAMKFLGIWPRVDDSIRSFYKLIWYFQTAGLTFQIFGPVAGMIAQMHDADVAKIVDNLGIVTPTVCIYLKWMSFRRNENTVARLLGFVETDWKDLLRNGSAIMSVFPDCDTVMRAYSRRAKIFIYSYLAMTTFAVVLFVGGSIGTAEGSDSSGGNGTDFDDILPLPNSWYPLDYNSSLNVRFLIAAQAATSMTTILANASMDGLFVTVALHVCGQFEILRFFIEGISYDPANPGSCESRVKLAVERHRQLLRITEQMQQSYNVIIFEHFLASTMTICFLEYTFIVEMETNGGSPVVMIKFGFLCTATMQITFAYCFVGDSLRTQSTGVGSSVYNAEWYDANKSVNLTLMLVMMRSEKPVEISAAKLFPLTLENFTVLIKTAASYLSVLRAIGVNEDGGSGMI